MPAAAVVGAVASIGAGVAVGASTLAGGLLIGGGVASLAGQVTGNKTLKTIGGIASLAGGGMAAFGVGTGAAAASSTANVTSPAAAALGEASSAGSLSGGFMTMSPAELAGTGAVSSMAGASGGASGLLSAGGIGSNFMTLAPSELAGAGVAGANPMAGFQSPVFGPSGNTSPMSQMVSQPAAPSVPSPSGFRSDPFGPQSQVSADPMGQPAQTIPPTQATPAAQPRQPQDIGVSAEPMGTTSQPMGTTAEPAGTVKDLSGFKQDPFGPHVPAQSPGVNITPAGDVVAGGQKVFDPRAAISQPGGVRQKLAELGRFVKNNKELVHIASQAFQTAFKGQQMPAEASQALEELRRAQAENFQTQTGILKAQQQNANNITGLTIGMNAVPGATPFGPGTMPAPGRIPIPGLLRTR